MACAAGLPVTAAAQAFPAKPVRVIVGYAAGGGNDVIMRIVAQKLGDNLGQPVIIENKPGAASIVKRLQDELAKTLRDAAVRDRLMAMAVTPDNGNAETFAKTIAIETALWAGVAKAASIKAE